MKTPVICGLLAVFLSGCSTYAVSPMAVSDVPASRFYWDNAVGEGYRIKVTRNVGQMGSLCMTHIFLDGVLAAEIGQAESVVFKVAPGSHRLKASPSLSTTTCRNFYSSSQFHIETTVNGGPGELRDFQYGFQGNGVPAFFRVGN